MTARAGLAGYAGSHPPTGSTFNSRKWLRFRFLLTGTLDFDAGGHLYATHALHPFAARCPPPLVAWALNRYTSPGDTVLDPMAGSGTTLVEAALLGRRAWGAEIDPLARLIGLAKARPVAPDSIISARDRLAGLLNVSDALDSTWRPELPDLHKWFREDVCADLSRLRAAIPLVDGQDCRIRGLLWVAFSSLIVARTSVANARDLVHSRHHIRVWTSNPDVPGRYHARLTRMANLMGDYIERLGGDDSDVRFVGTDARALPTPDESVDCVFTSPPYASALDYVRAHIFAVAWMADVLGTTTEQYRLLGRDYIGTERAPFRDVNGSDRPPTLGVREVDSVIDSLVASHPRHSWIVWRYFRDMAAVLSEIRRVLRPGGRAVLVVCPSNIRKVRIPTHELFVALARSPGSQDGALLELEELHERTIHDRRRVMPYLEAAFGPRMRTEYVVVFRRRE